MKETLKALGTVLLVPFMLIAIAIAAVFVASISLYRFMWDEK